MDNSSASLPSSPKAVTTVKAPRSKGCRVCVQRRIKCDQTRPFYQRCIRANRQCPGFDHLKCIEEGPGLRNMYDGPRYRQAAGQKTSPSAASQSSQGHYRPEDTCQSWISLLRAKQRYPSPTHSKNWHQGIFEKTALISLLAPTAYQDQLLANFIASLQQPLAAPLIRSHSLWLAEVARQPVHSPPLA